MSPHDGRQLVRSARWNCRSRSAGIAAVVFARQAPDDLAQHRLVDLFRRLRGGEPLDDPLLFFRPAFALAPHFKRKHMHVAEDDGAALEPLVIGEGADRALGDGPITPASSKASRAAEVRGDLPFFGQPFGMTQRWFSRDVMSMNCGRREPSRSRYGKAPY